MRKLFNTINFHTMKSNGKFLIVDLEVVREKGFEYFEKSEKWPVSESEFHEFSDFSRNLYNKIISNVDDAEVSDVALVESVFINQMINIFHYNYIKKYCEANNVELIRGYESSRYLDPEWEDMGNYYSKITNFYNNTIGFFRNKIKNIVFNKHLDIGKMVYGFFTRSRVVGIGSNDRIKQDYINNNNLFCDNKDGYAFISNASSMHLKSKNNDSISEFSERVVEKIIEPFFSELCSNSSLFIKDIDYDAIKKAWIKRFLDAYKIYKGLFLIDFPKILLVTEVGKPHSKLITLVFQRRGCKVLNFHHGNDSVLVNQYWVYQTLFNHCDNYVLDTRVMRERFKVLNNNDVNIRGKITKFISADSNYYSKLRKLTHSSNGKKIMLMGYPMNLERYPDEAYLFFHYKLTLEHMLASMMTSSGYHVTYKAHPDRLKEIKSIMLGVSNQIIEKPFEDVWRDVDILVFTYVPTTTFCYALNLPMPIVLIEIPGTPWYENMRGIIEKRVAILAVQVIEDELIIDNQEFMNKVDEARNKVYQQVSVEVTG